MRQATHRSTVGSTSVFGTIFLAYFPDNWH